MAKRNVIPLGQGKNRDHVSVNDDAKKVIADVAERLGMKEFAVASRVYTWFAKQPDVVQKEVLALLPEGHEAEVLRAALARHEAKKKGGK